MKKLIFLLMVLCGTQYSYGQSYKLYNSFEHYKTGVSDSIPFSGLRKIDKERLNAGDGDFTVKNNKDNRGVKDMLLVEYSDILFINCNRIKYYSGRYFAPAIAINDKVYFMALPGGQRNVSALKIVIVGFGVGLGAGAAYGTDFLSGDGIIPESYENKETNREFKYYDPVTQTSTPLSYEALFELLEPYKDLKEACLDEMMQQYDINKLEAPTIWRYLYLLKQRCEADTTPGGASGTQE